MTKQDIVEVLIDWPQPDASAPEPRVYATEGRLVVTYATTDEKFAVVEFSRCHQFVFGHPNDEALGGHALYARGLKFYSVHRIQNSSGLAALEKVNSVHDRHDTVTYLKDKEHFVFTFHDSTLECIVTTGEHGRPKISTFVTAAKASEAIRRDETKS